MHVASDMEIIAGVYQLKVPIPNNPVGFVLPYVFEVPGGISIVDPGWNAEESFQSLRGQLAEIGAGFGDLKQIIVTHVHPDHYGMAGRLRQISGAEVLVHEHDMEMAEWRAARGPDVVNGWFRRHGVPDGAGVATWMSAPQMGRGGGFDGVMPDRRMVDGELLRLGALELRVIWTPGHSPGHACFYAEEQELLFTGDHVLPTISPNVSLWPGSEADPLGDYIRSLSRLRGLRVRKVLPAHEYSFDDLETRLDELEHHHDGRLQEMIDAVNGGASTAYAIAREIRWTIGHFDSFDPGTRRAAVSETLSHLRYLVGEGRLVADEAHDVVHFRAAPM
jgi:glyoxylase-like metal-dependent hydrolase (beta-lactamase superfamily II)